MKKRLSILLVIVMVFAMMATVVGCGSDKDGDSGKNTTVNPTPTPDVEPTPEDEEVGIVGKWEAKVDFAKAMQSEEEFAGVDFGDSIISMYAEFDEDGNMQLSFDEDEMVDMMTGMLESMLESFAVEMEMSVDELLAEEGYDSMDEAIEDMIGDTSENLVTAGQYVLEDDKITMTLEDDYEEVWTIEFDGNSEFTVVESDDEETEALIPIEFKRV